MSIFEPQQRKLAVTIDDLPVVRGRDLDMRRHITDSLVHHLKVHEIPAVGFVNEKKLGEPVPSPDEVALLKAWLDAGMELGNHTYSHPSLFSSPLEEFKLDVLRGERITKRLLEERGLRLRWFRHPFLNTGPSHDTKVAFEEFLAREGYTVAPVTIDNSEWIYADAYDAAKMRGDTALTAAIGDDYIRHMSELFDFYEKLSQDLFNREPPQVLLLHANQLNADRLNSLIHTVKRRGYTFVSLEDSLHDSAYSSPDKYVGREGISWLQRWWMTRGNSFLDEPEVPGWIKVAQPSR